MDIDKGKLSLRFSILMGVVFAFAVSAYLLWSMNVQNITTEDKVLTEARTLNLEMQASWDYMDQAQNAINYNSDGSYDFKGIYCSVAGKNIANRFTSAAKGYVIRFARNNPRSYTDAPDEFEARAIDYFTQNQGNEYYGVDVYDGKEVFRYAAMLEIKDNCLICHGEPAGTKDETGFLKEGMKLGDLAGVASIVIPIDLYRQESQIRLIQNIIFFLLLALLIIVVLRFGLRRWVVEPLNKSNMQLYKENKAQQDFLTIMSHELRTPLSSIIAFTDVWEGYSEDRSCEERKMVDEIRENAQTLLTLVNNTIDTAKIESDSFSIFYDEVDLVDVIQSVTAVVGPLAFENGISIKKSIDRNTPIIVSDSNALRKIFMNIVGNAVKYSPTNGAVSIDVRSENNRVYVSVQDEGPGIPPEARERVFERFARVERNGDGSNPSGSGLGLFLAKNLTERLGGVIELESEMGKGSRFIVELPIDATTERQRTEGKRE